MEEEHPKHHTMLEARIQRHQSIRETISAAPSTMLANLLIELAAAGIMIFGLLFLLRFLFMFRDRYQEGYFKFILYFIIFFAVGWGTHLAFKLRSHYVKFRAALAAKRNLGQNPPLS